MKEKILAFLQSEKVKKINRKVFNKKTLVGVIVVIVLCVALKVAFSLMFEVEGVVKKVDGSKITVANFLSTKTVDVGDYPIANKGIQVGDRIEITKNLSGDILYVRDQSKKHINGNANKHANGKQKLKGKNNSKERE